MQAETVDLKSFEGCPEYEYWAGLSTGEVSHVDNYGTEYLLLSKVVYVRSVEPDDSIRSDALPNAVHSPYCGLCAALSTDED